MFFAPSRNIKDFFIQGGHWSPTGVPFYGKNKKVKPKIKQRSKRNKKGFLSNWHKNQYD